MKRKNRAILKTEEETPRVRQACGACQGRGEVKDADPYRDRESRVACQRCAGMGYLSALLALLLLLVCNADAATVTGTIRNRQGALISTNIVFKSVQRPLFDTTPSVLPGWTLTTNSASNGTFSTPLMAGNYQVTMGGELRDSFLILVPTNAASYEIVTLVTNAPTYFFQQTINMGGAAAPSFDSSGFSGFDSQ